MFFRLMNKEIKGQLKSITFYMFLIVLLIYYITQYIPPTPYDPLKPIPSNLKSNGTKGILANKLNEMTFVYYRMNYSLENEVYAKYNLGFKKWHRLNTEEKEFLQQIKDKIYNDTLNDDGTPEILVSYDEFQKIKGKIDRRLGGNTVYSSKYGDNIFLDVLYGHKTIDDPNLKIRAGYIEMNIILRMNEYLKMSPIINWYKQLSDDQRASLERAIKRISPKGLDKNGDIINPISYEEYEIILDELEEELADTTIFSKKYRNKIYWQNKTYNEAVEDFNEILLKDKITNAYARYFSDYMGITAGLYPIFIVLTVFLRDRKKNISRLIYDKKISPITYILSKYSAICICLLICYLLLAAHSTYVFYNIGKNYNYLMDLGAFYKYTLTWIAPTIMFTTALSMLLFIIINKMSLTIVIHLVLWFISLQQLCGDYKLYKYIIRFNSLGDYKSYILWKPAIIGNRIFFTILSLMIIIITAYIYNHRMKKTSSSIL